MDILIVGGGILGCTAAYYLRSAGFKVTLLEMGDIASGASGANLGQISLLDRYEEWHLELAMKSLKEYERLAGEWNMEYCNSGGSVILMNRQQIDRAEEVVALQRERGLKAEVVKGGRINSIEPYLSRETAKAMAWCPEEGRLDPLTVTLAYAEKAREIGANFEVHRKVDSLETADGRIVKVLAGNKVYTPDLVINAAGSRFNRIMSFCGITTPLRYHRGSAMVSVPMPRLINGPLVGGGLFLKGIRSKAKEASIGSGIVQNEHGSILIAQATEEVEGFDKSTGSHNLMRISKNILRSFPSLDQLQIIRAWAGLTPWTLDSKPVFGFSGSISNMFSLAGFKGAFTTAPAIAMTLAEYLKGHSPDKAFLAETFTEREVPDDH